MTLRELKAWIATIPPECDDAEVFVCGGGIEIAGRDEHGGFNDWIAVNGTEVDDE